MLDYPCVSAQKRYKEITERKCEYQNPLTRKYKKGKKEQMPGKEKAGPEEHSLSIRVIFLKQRIPEKSIRGISAQKIRKISPHDHIEFLVIENIPADHLESVKRGRF